MVMGQLDVGTEPFCQGSLSKPPCISDLKSYPDRMVQFLHPAGPSPSFSFPTRDDILTVKHIDILMKANPTISKSRWVYSVSTSEAA